MNRNSTLRPFWNTNLKQRRGRLWTEAYSYVPSVLLCKLRDARYVPSTIILKWFLWQQGYDLPLDPSGIVQAGLLVDASAEYGSETFGSKNDRKLLRCLFYSQEWILYCMELVTIRSLNSHTNITCYHDFVSSSASKMTRCQTHQTSALHLYTENSSFHFI